MVHCLVGMSSRDLQKNGALNTLRARQVVTVKWKGRKCCKDNKKHEEENSDAYLALLELWNIPSEKMKTSPSQRLFGQRTRTLLPSAKTFLRPHTWTEVKEKLIRRKQAQQGYYNRGTVELDTLRSGQASSTKLLQQMNSRARQSKVGTDIKIQSTRI